MSETFEGGCSCGAVRYRLTSRPMFTNCCHCLDCQKQTGGAFAINAMIETSRIEILSGEPVVIDMPSPSGRGHEVHRCPKCEVALWSNYGRRTWMRFVRVATLDAPHAIKPDAHIFTRSKAPWVKLPEDVPAFEIYYDTPKQWSPESLTRLAAASGKA
ncbi:GFA family protein [Vitreimonas flagellata]|uniref:GFA family protein n=1 Tax=Vitreimonas flagellata TaxID=2560861 RepID=UPI001074D3D8|nr:GFA family protein [Vitreimonas flagellata]